MTTHDLGLVRVLGVVALLPALADHAGAAFGVVAFAAHLVSLSGRPQVAGRAAAFGLAAATLACGLVAHAVTGQVWTLVALAAALQCAVRVDPLPVAVAGIAVCTAVAPLMGTTGDLVTSLVIVAGPGLIAALRHRLLVTITELRATREQLAEAAVRRERDRFSDDLHDLLGHSLSVIVVSAQVVQRVAVAKPEHAVEVGAEIETIGRRALDDVRDAVLGYRARSLAEESTELQRSLRAAGITPDFGDPVPLPEDVDATLALVLREAVTNVVRHSGAGTCRVRLTAAAAATLEITDDGTGDAAAARRAEAGLATVRARLAEHAGQLLVEPLAPHGLRVTAIVALERAS